MEEYKLFHVTRNLAKHAFELDDAIHGSPLHKEVTDWAVKNPGLYVQRLTAEKLRLEALLSDLQYVMRCKNIQMELKNKPFDMNEEDCDAYIYHRFHHRSFSYAEKVSFWLQEKTPEDIDLIVPKAKRQLNALVAAIQDVNVSLVRYSNYYETAKETEG